MSLMRALLPEPMGPMQDTTALALSIALSRSIHAQAGSAPLLLHPCLRCGVEQSQGEHRLAFEHGHESAFDQGPEVLLFPVLLGRIRQRQILHDTEPLDPLDSLRGFHRRAVVAEQRTRRASLLDPLRETV